MKWFYKWRSGAWISALYWLHARHKEMHQHGGIYAPRIRQT